MRRKDREVTEMAEILDILQRCDTLRLGIRDGENPYVVPLSFGFEQSGTKLLIYFHCAPEGMKADLLRKNAAVGFEGDIFLGYEKTEHGITARYESVMGSGHCEFLENEPEILHGLALITSHCGFPDYPNDRCAGLQKLRIGRITVDTITGKRNLPGGMTTADKENEITNTR